MNMKKQIKNMLGVVRCSMNCISIKPNNSHVYIGKNVKVVGGKGIRLSSEVCIRPYVSLWCNGGEIEIGRGTEIGERCRISIVNSLIIGEDTLISPNVYITDCDHAYEEISVPIMKQGIVNSNYRVRIEKHVYVGINVVIVGNITIGQGSVIGANSVVTRSIPEYCVAVGAPAQIIKKYNIETKKWERYKSL